MFYRKFVIMVCAGLTWLAFAAARPAHAAIRGTRHPLRVIAYDYAVSQHGKRYCWGGSGPSCYDCSGLVSAAYRHVHILIGRTTYDMLRSGRLIRISRSQARRGDLAFYGSGHVEFYDHASVTFGAHTSGTRIGWLRFGSYWQPTAYYRIRGAGKPTASA
jgi:cell wall-associated NlpC family hydrolase